MSPVPASRADELFDEAHQLYLAKQKPSEFIVAKAKREILRQTEHTPTDGNAYGALMFINVLEKDLDGLRNTYNRVRARVDIQFPLFTNASLAFVNVGDAETAWNVVSEGLRRYPNTKAVIECAIRVAMTTGRARAASRILEAYTPTQNETLPNMESVAPLNDFYARHDITDDQGALLIPPMIAALREFTHRPVEVAPDVLVYSEDLRGSPRAVIRFIADVTPSQSVDAMDRYQELVLESGVPRRVQRLLSADVECASNDHERQAA